eukprot:4164693-Pyramimonas_sp.AAC.2
MTVSSCRVVKEKSVHYCIVYYYSRAVRHVTASATVRLSDQNRDAVADTVQRTFSPATTSLFVHQGPLADLC